MRALNRSVRIAAAAVVLVGATPSAPLAWAVDPPTIPADAGDPPDPPPAPDQPMRQDHACNLPGVLPAPPVADIPAAQVLLDVDQAHKFSTGDGVTVAVIDTGVAPNPRLPRLAAGGDYVDTSDGLVDCDMHGTLVASIIGAQRAAEDQFVGVAPGANLISIRQSSNNYTPERPEPVQGQSPGQVEAAGKLDALAAAIVHAANMGARVINMSVVACIPIAHPIDQTKLATAVRYAAVVKDAVLVAAAGNVGAGNADCQANPGYDPLLPADPRNWAHVVAVSSPSWFSDYVMSVGAVDESGAPGDKTNAAKFSMSGPWVDIAGPGVNTVALGPAGEAINALPGPDGLVNIFGTSFSAAYVSGVAALVRAKFPDLTAAQVRRRLTDTAHTGPRGVDNAVGHGLVDPVAALTYELPASDPHIVETHRQVLIVAPPPPPPDPRAHRWALLISALVLVGAGISARFVVRQRSTR
ncbi:type VII secretion-associated serine protease mycosin [Mycobacterium eburneum]|nr:type VII secretion-associated serine protease mycosin [Mycobacterium eburneum]TDH48466.1 type VII secretion-associated serine protease mycosin [Mycobacterium eburneum]